MNDINPIESFTGLRKFKSYPTYKDSGIEWLGKIPAHWEVKRLKRLAGLRAGMAITSESIEENGDYPVFGGNGIRGFTSSYSHEGEFPLIGRQGALCGCVNFASGKFWASEHAVVASPQPKVEARWLAYLLRAMSLNSYSESAAQPGLAVDTIAVLPVPMPAPSEQHTIVAFLDRETAKIDALVAKNERLIELLQEKRAALITRAVTKGLDSNVPMKDSGVEWLGEIPARWELIPLQAACEIRGRIGYRGYSVADIVPPGLGAITLSPSNIVDDGLDLSECTYLSWYKYHESPEIQIELNDIILTKTGSTLGKVALVTRCDEAMTINPQLVILRCREGINPAFMAYLLRCDGIKDLYWLENSGGATPTISQQKVGQFRVPFPGTVEEQWRIAAFLDREISRIANLIAKVRDAIVHLMELRTALISAAVTGKIDVREEAA